MQKEYSPLLSDEAMQYICEGIKPVKRIIVTAANKLEDGLIIVGVRHWCPLMHSMADRLNLTVKETARAEQGFVDQYGQFLDRVTAKRIAIKNEQPLIGEDWGDELFSENLH